MTSVVLVQSKSHLGGHGNSIRSAHRCPAILPSFRETLAPSVEKPDAVFANPETASVSRHSGDRRQFGPSFPLLWAGTEVVKLATDHHQCFVRSIVGFSGHLAANSSEFRSARPNSRVSDTDFP